MRSIGAIQVDQQAILPINAFLFLPENRDIRPTETIDGLAHVPNHEEAAAIAGQGIDDVALTGIGVLVLVDHDRVQFLLPTFAHFRDFQ
jgi:hypothetical protein